MTSKSLSSGLENTQSVITQSVKKPLTVSPNDDVSLSIETVSGKLVNPTNPNLDDIDIEDIAWALSRIPRFAGHTITEIPYNVAQHSLYVCELVQEYLTNSNLFPDRNTNLFIPTINNAEFLIKALIHDAHETYTGDIPSPIKKIPELNETIKLVESRLDHAIYSKLGLSEKTDIEHNTIKYFDRMAQAIEGYQFMPSRGLNWILPKPPIQLLQKFPKPLSPIDSYTQFLEYFNKRMAKFLINKNSHMIN